MSVMTELHKQIAEFINERNGDHVEPAEVIRKFKLEARSCTRHLNELTSLGLILMKGTKRSRSFCMVPAPQHEWKAAAIKPMTIDKQRRELYAMLAEARNQIPSRG